MKLLLLAVALFFPVLEAAAAGFRQPDAKAHPDLFVWTDTCNVYVLRDGDAALLIDLGDGSVLDRLAEIGVKKVEWVLFTHHHREQCQGFPRLQGWSAKIGAPEAERLFFEQPASFRKMKVSLRDRFTIHGTSFVRPPIQPIPIDRAFKSMDTFEWRGRKMWCVSTPGNSPGAMSYMWETPNSKPPPSPGPKWTGQTPNLDSTQNPEPKTQNSRVQWLGFTGDLMLAGGKLHTWFDSEWDYGLGAGVWATASAAAQIEGYRPAWIFPSHGPAIREPAEQLAAFQQNLFRFEKLYAKDPQQATLDRTSKPTVVPHIWQVLPHVYKFRGPNFSPNFYLIIADSGRALAVDCGLLDVKVLDAALEGMKQHLGLKKIDAMIPTHMHGDHFLRGPHLREKWGAQLWALDLMAPMCEHPEWFDYAAPIQAYDRASGGGEGVRFDRLFKPGEILDWEGYRFSIDWMPGQTEFALCVAGMIDGRKVAFTGDNIGGDPDDPRQNGHRAMVAHNSGILEEGYIYGAEYLSRLKPDILLGGHSHVMDKPAGLIKRYRAWAYEMRDAFRTLSSEDDYRYWFDPYWVRAEPYRSSVRRGESIEVALHLRNFRPRVQSHRVEIHAPPGLVIESAPLEGELKGEERRPFPVRLRAAADAKPGVHIVALDITRDGKRYGELFDFVVEVKP